MSTGTGLSIATRLTLALTAVAVLVSGVALSLLGLANYRDSREALRAELIALGQPNAPMELALYQRNFHYLMDFVERAADIPGALNVALFDPQGRILAVSERAASPSALKRANRAPTVVIEAETADGALLQMSIPVLTRIGPDTPAGATDSDLLAPRGQAAGSQYVAAYLEVGIDLATLQMAAWRQLQQPLLICLAACVLLALLTLVLSRRVTASLAALAVFAEEIASGERLKPVELKGPSEVKRISSLLNVIIDRFDSHRAQLGVDHQLLGMKVAERTSQLSDRNRELKDAVRQITTAKERMRRLAYYDSLTSLPNRALFTEQLELLLRLAKRNDHRLALIFIDLDNFKRINDSLGHSAGDQLLAEVANRLIAGVRDSDMVGHIGRDAETVRVSRLGGDEFTVVVNQVADAQAVELVANRLLAALSSPITIGNHDLVVTPSIGIAIAPDHAKTVEDLLRRADRAMYQAKSRGKNTFCFYDGQLEAAEEERLRLESDLRKALERDELLLHYQPQIDIRSGNVVGVEALVRWNHPERGLVPPSQFVTLAEELGLIGELGHRVLQLACTEVRNLADQGITLQKVAVNVSSLQFHSGYAGNVKAVLLETGIDPARLELELTESVIVEHVSEIMQALEELRAMGVRLSVDDFGTGYSALSYLSRFPLNELKIDRSFVIEIGRSDSAASLINAIIAMARGLNLDVVAEGVETLEQCRFLQERGVTVIQGYLFSKPVPASELPALLRPGAFAERVAALRAQ